MLTAMVSVACLAIGLYAGKRRAKGSGWKEIACELAKGARDVAEIAWRKATWPFRREKAP